MTKPAVPPTIVVLGGINMDLIGITPRLAGPGETVVGERFYTTPGGKGGNQAVAAARMGARVKMIGRVGEDVFGPGLIESLRGHGVDVSSVALDPDYASGIAVILLDANRQNHIVAIYGANTRCDGQELLAVERALEGADALLLQLETPYEVSLRAARTAKKRGVPVIWDPAPATAGFPPETYAALDFVTPNQTEAHDLTGIKVTGIPSARDAAEALLRKGAPVAVIKLGEAGVYYSTPRGGGHISSFDVEVTDSVAAGDAFAGAFAVALGEGKGLEEALHHGTAAGALAVTRPGAQDAMPSRDDVESLLAG